MTNLLTFVRCVSAYSSVVQRGWRVDVCGRLNERLNRANGRVVVVLAVCVPYASVIEKLETVVGQNRTRRREGSWHTPHRGCRGRRPGHRSGGDCRGKEQKDEQRQYLLRSGSQVRVRCARHAANVRDRERSI